MCRNKVSFYGEELLAPHPNSKLEDHPLQAVHDCLFNIFAATLHIAGRSSIRNPRTHYAVVKGTLSFILFN
jgi:cytochrome b